MGSAECDVDVACVMEDGRRLLVLYGSQTGTAQDTAERIGREGKRRHFRTRVLPMDNYDKVRARNECTYLSNTDTHLLAVQVDL